MVHSIGSGVISWMYQLGDWFAGAWMFGSHQGTVEKNLERRTLIVN
jgi:hypothetical protein